MTRLIRLLWTRGLVATFLSGLFALLPILITVAIVSWAATQIHGYIGPSTTVGNSLRNIGLQFVTDETTAFVIGWIIVLAGVWLVGLFVRAQTRSGFGELIDATVTRIPIVKGIYGTAAQVVGMLHKDEHSELQQMRVVFCSFGDARGAGCLGLLAGADSYSFSGQRYQAVYVPTSPFMSGGIVFVPSDRVIPIDMTADGLMQIYFSLGVLTPQVMPEAHRVA